MKAEAIDGKAKAASSHMTSKKARNVMTADTTAAAYSQKLGDQNAAKRR
jgi:hypothetical protein